jgi:hypothetical protein
VKGPLCAALDGFSLHAGAWVSARDREKLEKLCQYAARPAVPESRLVELADGRVGYSLKKRWRDGTTAVVMTKQVLMERLCALVPTPRKHLVTYHGVLELASGLRSRVVPRRVEEAGESVGCQHGAGDGPAGQEATAAAVAKGEPRTSPPPRSIGSRPSGGFARGCGFRMVAAVDDLAVGGVCPKCSGIRRVLAAISDPESIARVLEAMGLSAAVSEQAACRAPSAVEEFGSDSECVAE